MTDNARLNAARRLLAIWGDPDMLNDSAANRTIIHRRPAAAEIYAAAFGLATEGPMWARAAYDDAWQVANAHRPPLSVHVGWLDPGDGDSPPQQVMVTRWAGGRVDMAWRTYESETWGPPAELTPMAVNTFYVGPDR